MKTNRRQFFSQLSMALAGSSLVAFAIACGGEDDIDTGETSGGLSCTAAGISNNHGHALLIPFADVEAGEDRTYSIQGQSGHDHQITLTAADFDALVAGDDVLLTSTDGASHTHDVTLRCVG